MLLIDLMHCTALFCTDCSLFTIIQENSIPSRWDVSIILKYVKGKGAALDRSNYRGLELIEHALKVFEKVIENLLRDKVDIGSKQFGFMPGKGTTDVIFVVRQVKVCVHQGSVLSPILFAIVLEALS